MAVRDLSMEHMTSSKSSQKLRKVRKSCVLYEGDAPAMRKKFIPGDVRYYTIQIILLGVIIGACIALGIYLNDTGQAQARYRGVIEEYTEPEPIPTREMDPDTSAWPPIVNWEELKGFNQDVAGWIRIPGTDVDYPIMVNDQKEFYLNHNMYGNYDASGAIFADYENSRDLSDQHLVIYGHHMNVSTMFHAVSQYRDPAFFESHRVIYLETPETTYVLKPVGVYIAQAEEYEARHVIFGSGNDFQSYFDGRQDRIETCKHDDFNRNVNDMEVTLITCTNTGESRVIVECVAEQSYPTSMVPNVIARAMADAGYQLNANGKVEVAADQPVPEYAIDPNAQQ